MKCGYCGKRFPTNQLDRDMWRNESWGTPWYYSNNQFSNEIVTEAGFDPEDSDNLLCPDCLNKLYDVQKKHSDEMYGDGKVTLKLGSAVSPLGGTDSNHPTMKDVKAHNEASKAEFEKEQVDAMTKSFAEELDKVSENNVISDSEKQPDIEADPNEVAKHGLPNQQKQAKEEKKKSANMQAQVESKQRQQENDSKEKKPNQKEMNDVARKYGLRNSRKVFINLFSKITDKTREKFTKALEDDFTDIKEMFEVVVDDAVASNNLLDEISQKHPEAFETEPLDEDEILRNIFK